MSRSNKRLTSLLPHLPHELLSSHILSRLPAQSVLRFCCTSKLWCTTIEDPKFITDHLLRAKENSHLLGIFEDENQNAQHLVFNLDSVINNEGEGSMDMEKLRKATIAFAGPFKTLVGSCNGLICFRSCFRYESFDPSTQKTTRFGLEICNPSTREILVIPLPNVDQKMLSSPYYGLGYDSLKHEYKVVCISDTKKCVMVYTLGTNSWRSVAVVPTNMPTHIVHLEELPILSNGTLKWYHMDPSHEICEIFSFDIHSEELEIISAPIFDTDDCRPMFDLQGCLCFARANADAIDLYRLKKDHFKHYWVKESIRLPPGDGVGLSLMKIGAVAFFKKVFLHWIHQRLVTMYNIHTGSQKEVKLLDNFQYYKYRILNHVENLLSLKSFVPSGESEVVCVSSRVARGEGIKDDRGWPEMVTRECHFL